MDKVILKAITPNLMVENVNDTVDYYKELGFKVLITIPEEGKLNWAMLQHTGVMLMLQERNNLIAEYPSLKDQSKGGAFTLFIEVEDVEHIYSQIKNKAKIIKDLHTIFYGMKEFSMQDCNNFILTFAERES